MNELKFSEEIFVKQDISLPAYDDIHMQVSSVVSKYCDAVYTDISADELERKTTEMFRSVIEGLAEIVINGGVQLNRAEQNVIARAMLDSSIVTMSKSREDMELLYSKKALKEFKLSISHV